MQVFVLLFNAGRENEGIHTIRIGDRNLVLIFEQEDDATRYALLLEAQDFPVPTVEAMEQADIEEFCESTGYEGQLVPAGFVPQTDAERLLLAPPESNLVETDWQKDKQPETPQPELEPESEADAIAAAELERIRRQLEGLL
ncbi:DUF3110 domain-containing protein [Leptolyngbya sp. FACHB-321]|uniref:DUF3110 domain-containing protein n=1 Tax=Leptolyngbya sp. FACHB-321 TaxID=2692807 RepID=UPI0016839A79|nr:DUF3110 domain-containing protein [Leptolyngbya sp. FACHB-321]MBD2036680.1 DUF3110 domain-containing protein [Leptolyngbya sp. FACHB-321]